MTNKLQERLDRMERSELFNEIDRKINAIDDSVVDGESLEYIRRYDKNDRIVYEWLEGYHVKRYEYDQQGKLKFKYVKEYDSETYVVYYDSAGNIEARISLI